MEVKVFDGNIERAIRSLRISVMRDGSLARFRERDKGYVKPGERKRRKHFKAISHRKRLMVRKGKML